MDDLNAAEDLQERSEVRLLTLLGIDPNTVTFGSTRIEMDAPRGKVFVKWEGVLLVDVEQLAPLVLTGDIHTELNT